MMDYIVNVGLEIHVELATKTKIFCSCKNEFGAKPNTNVCPICLGYPATLPAVNKNAVILAIKAGLALGSRISPRLLFDRKHYFYPDLPKAYQISQDKLPLAIGGGIKLDSGKFVRFNHIHLEEDAGKLIHDPETNKTFIDFNRAGLPLIEHVTEVDISNGAEAVEFLTKLKQKLIFAGISNCRMECGQMRCDVNVSVRKTENDPYGTKVEMKNLSSFKAVASAIDYESKRQILELESDHKIVQETRKWDEQKNITTPMRKKEKAQDYRYMPEPDFVSINISPSDIESIKNSMSGGIDELLEKYTTEYAIPLSYSKLLLSDKVTNNYFENCLKILFKPKEISNWIVDELFKFKTGTSKNLNELISEEYLCSIVNLLDQSKITRTVAKTLLEQTILTKNNPIEIAKQNKLTGISSEKICALVDAFLSQNPDLKAQYKQENKNEKIVNFVAGNIIKQTQGKADPNTLKEYIKKQLKKR